MTKKIEKKKRNTQGIKGSLGLLIIFSIIMFIAWPFSKTSKEMITMATIFGSTTGVVFVIGLIQYIISIFKK